MIGFVSFVVMFSLLVFVHELGHFTVAKLAKVNVEEFGFGYPPRLAKLGTWRGTLISLNWLPVGGFVRMSEDDPTVPGSLAGKGRITRALVYVAGALMNVALAVALFSATFLIGAPMPVEGPGAGIYIIMPQSPADLAGMRPGDNIVSINGQTVRNVQHAVELIRSNLGRSIEIVTQRDGKLLPPVRLVPRADPPPNEGALGVSLDLPLSKQAYPLWEAVPLGVRATYNTVRGIFAGFRAVIRKQLPFQVSGPVGIYQVTVQVANTGWVQLLEFSAFLSLNLFLFNLLPLPALDGGRLVFVLIEWVRGGRKVPPEREGFVHLVGMAILLILMAIVTFFDVMRYFSS